MRRQPPLPGLVLVLSLALAGLPSPGRADDLRPVDVVDAGAIEPSKERWMVVFGHVHSAVGGWSYGPGGAGAVDRSWGESERLLDLLPPAHRLGLEAVVATEHNTVAHFGRYGGRSTDPETEPVLLFGVEYSGSRGHGHAGFVYLPKDGEDCLRPADTRNLGADEIRAAIADVDRRGGLSVVHHPFLPWFPWPDESTLGADAIEVFSPAPASTTRNLEWWQARLIAEERSIAPMSGADFHPVARAPLLDRTELAALRGYHVLVRTEEATPAAILEGLRAGRVVARRLAPWRAPAGGPRVHLAAGPDLAGRIGDEVPAGDDPVVVQVHVTGADGFEARLYDESSAEPVARFTVDGDDDVRAFEKTLAGRWGFVRVELARPLAFDRVASGLVTFRRPR